MDETPNIFHRILSALAAPTLLVSIVMVIWMSGGNYLDYEDSDDLVRTVSAVLCIYFLVLFTNDMIACFSKNFRKKRSLIRRKSIRLCEIELALMMMLPVAPVFVYQALFDELTWYFDKDIVFFILAAVCLIHLSEYVFAGILIIFDIIDGKEKPAPFNVNDNIELNENKGGTNE